MKRLYAFIVFPLLLAACGGEGPVAVDCHKEYWDGTVGACLPQGWGVVDSETLRQRGVPEDTIVAFQAEEAVSGQFPTVTVTSEPLSDVTAPTTYSKASIRSVSVLPGYTLIDSVQVNIDAEAIDLHVFTAKPVADEPSRRFYQVSTVANNMGYTLTATTPVSIDDALEKQVYFILQSATFKVEEEE